MPAVSESGKTILVTGRGDVAAKREKGRHNYRMDISLGYDAAPDGLPDAEASKTLDAITEAFHEMCRREKGVVLTGIFTGDGSRDWMFYAVSPEIFRRAFNIALRELPVYPFIFEAFEDPAWEAYDDMAAAAPEDF